MNYIKEAEKYLYHYRDLNVSIENMNKEISKLITSSGPKDISAMQYDVTCVSSSSQDEAMNVLFKIKTLTNSKEQTEKELSKIDNILKEISKEKGSELYGQILKKWYIEKVPKEDIAKAIGYSNSSRRSIYTLKGKAIRKFAIRFFGIEVLKVI